MSRNAISKSQVFLMEFILVILLFALCGATCISAFVKADSLSRESRELNQGMLLVQSAVECVKASTDSYEELSQLPGLLKSTLNMEGEDGERYLSYYDSDFNSCEKEKAAYYLELSLTYGEPQLLQAEARVMKLDMPSEAETAKAVQTVKSEESQEPEESPRAPQAADPICSLTTDRYVPYHGKAGGENE